MSPMCAANPRTCLSLPACRRASMTCSNALRQLLLANASKTSPRLWVPLAACQCQSKQASNNAQFPCDKWLVVYMAIARSDRVRFCSQCSAKMDKPCSCLSGQEVHRLWCYWPFVQNKYEGVGRPSWRSGIFYSTLRLLQGHLSSNAYETHHLPRQVRG